MNWHRSLCIAAAAMAGLAGTTLSTGPASADFATKIDPAITLGSGAFPCAGYVRALYDPARESHGRQVVWLRADFGYRLAQVRVCAAEAILSWRNIDTGEAGSSMQPLPLHDGRTRGRTDAMWVPFDLGRHPGHYQVLVGTDLPHVNGSGEITVPR
ncbi:hypothetical protein [Nocardia alni]|uniref:hypothetical protein n=1 Tax=Nocardia alni TaxID=2815723 RepID=UPI001C214E91|nr:hypothetical protein [Nocardia alni]